MAGAHDSELSTRVQSDLARANELFDRLARRADGGSGATPGRPRMPRSAAAVGRRVANIGVALGVLIVATLVFGFAVGPIGIGGLFLVISLMVLAIAFFSIWPGERPVPAFREDLSNQAVVQRLGTILERRRGALPAPAGRHVAEIKARLPLLESRLGEADLLDPLAQDARRLMGKHLPELIERYERVPPQFRRERDGEGISVDERLTQGLAAASGALDDLARKLAREDVDAFETQGRFIETRYKDSDRLGSG
jgi:hypothetical protein